MDRPAIDLTLVKNINRHLQDFVQAVTGKDNVQVREAKNEHAVVGMNTKYEIVHLELLGVTLPPDARKKLEQGVASAVTAVLKDISLLHAERLTRMIQSTEQTSA